MIFFLSFVLFHETIPDEPFVYKGSSPREVVVVDPAHSPLLEEAYQGLKNDLTSALSEREILEMVVLHVREKVFDLSLCSKEQLLTLIAAFYPGELEPEIPLDIFMAHQTGVCRHFALLTTYFIDRLIGENILQGKALFIRDQTKMGRHAWTLFLTSESAWHLDAYRGFIQDAVLEEGGWDYLVEQYGMRTMERQKERWDR